MTRRGRLLDRIRELEQQAGGSDPRFCDDHRGVWRSSGCLACAVMQNGQSKMELRRVYAEFKKTGSDADAVAVWQAVERLLGET